MSHLLESASVEIHDNTISCDAFAPDPNFGLISLHFANVGVTKTPTFILFSIDRTDSMKEENRMNHLKQTFQNIVKFLADQESTEVYIRVHAFNTEVSVLVETQRISRDNSSQIIESIMNLQPDGSTAIDIALVNSSIAMNEYATVHPGHAIFHVFMTDGEPTVGTRSANSLADLVNVKFPSIFIGFGMSHNSSILRKLSEPELNRYEIVDDMEHTGVVYGNIMHEILHRSLSDVKLSVENGSIYDWKTNAWVNSITEAFIVGDSKKNYHVKTGDLDRLKVVVTGVPVGISESVELETLYVLPDLEDMETGEIQTSRIDLSRYMYRQIVQEAMFKSRSTVDYSNFKVEIAIIFKKMRRFMRNGNMTTDRMLMQLCDDLCIMHRTIGTRDGRILTLAREQSQGRQQSNTVPMTPRTTQTQDHGLNLPRLSRMYTPSTPRQPRHIDWEDEDSLPFVSSITPLRNCPDEYDSSAETTVFQLNLPEDEFSMEDEISNYMLRNDPISCFASPSAVNTMRTMTQPY